MRSTFLPRLAIKVANYMKKIREKFLFDHDEFNDILVYLILPFAMTCSAFAGSLMFVLLTR